MTEGLFSLLGQGPVLGMKFFVFRKMECPKQKNHLLCGMLPVKRTMKNNNFSSVSQLLADGIFTLPAMQVCGIPLVSLHAVFVAAFVYYNNLCNYLSFLPVLPGL